LEKAATIVCELGHQVDLARPIFGRESLIRSYFTIVSSHLAHEISSAARLNGRQPRFDELEPATWFLLQVGRSRSAEDLIAAREVIFREARTVALFFENYDVLMTPTLAAPPAKVGQFALSWWEQFGIEALKKVPVPSHRLEQLLLLLAKQTLNASPNTMLFNQTGQPAMSLPLAMSDSGLPIGIQFVGAYGRDDLLFQLAGQVERLASWAERRPEWLAY